MGETVRWGILSTARISGTFAKALAESPDCEVHAIGSRNLARAQKWAKDYGAALAFGSYQELLDCGEISALYNPLPNNLHAEWTIRALEAGIPVLCEKPLTSNAAEAQDVLNTARKTGITVAEAFMYRYYPMYDRLCEVLASGEIGEVVSMHAKFGFALENRHDIRRSAELAGGSLLDLGCYCVNFARRFAGAEPSRVCAYARLTSVDDTVQGIMEFPNGVLAQIECSIESQLGREAKIRGTHGRIIVPEAWLPGEDQAQFIVDIGGKQRVETTPGANPYRLEAEDFVRALHGDGQLRWPLQDALGNMKALDALSESFRTGKEVLLER